MFLLISIEINHIIKFTNKFLGINLFQFINILLVFGDSILFWVKDYTFVLFGMGAVAFVNEPFFGLSFEAYDVF